MKINKIKLANFRNYSEGNFPFAQTTAVVGANGAGKTNLLEAIYLLATTKSLRANKNAELIQREKEFSRIEGEISEQAKATKLTLTIFPTFKRAKMNDVAKKTVDFLGQFFCIWFSPESLNIISGSPSTRRRFFDLLLSQTDRSYALALLEYQKVLMQRNHLLAKLKEEGGNLDELNIWDQQLAERATIIVEERKEAVSFLEKEVTQIYQEITGIDNLVGLEYQKSLVGDFLVEKLRANREAEIKAQATLFGPHRDDFVFLLNGFSLASFGSRGEIRTAVLALKLAEKAWIEQKKKVIPVILLDDAFSELDPLRRGNLLLLTRKQQSIISTTHLSLLPQEIQKNDFLVLEVHDGRLKKTPG